MLAEVPYIPIKITKHVLGAFEHETKTGAAFLVNEYLEKCELEEGSINGLLSDCSYGDGEYGSYYNED